MQKKKIKSDVKAKRGAVIKIFNKNQWTKIKISPQTVNWKAKNANRKVFLVKFVWKMGGQPNGALLLSLTTRISGGSGNNHSRKLNIETRSMQWIISILFFILIFNTKQLNADNREELGEFFACICFFYFNFESVLQNWQGNNLHCYDHCRSNDHSASVSINFFLF